MCPAGTGLGAALGSRWALIGCFTSIRLSVLHALCPGAGKRGCSWPHKISPPCLEVVSPINMLFEVGLTQGRPKQGKLGTRAQDCRLPLPTFCPRPAPAREGEDQPRGCTSRAYTRPHCRLGIRRGAGAPL